MFYHTFNALLYTFDQFSAEPTFNIIQQQLNINSIAFTQGTTLSIVKVSTIYTARMQTFCF
jgi:hypothetical protein